MDLFEDVYTSIKPWGYSSQPSMLVYLSEEMENLQQSLNAVVLQLLQNQAASRTWVCPSLAEFGGQWW